MANEDSSQRFIFEHAQIRGEIAHLNQTYQTIMQQQPYPPMVKNLLGEALVACLLLTSSIKFEGEVSLQFRGDDRLPLLIVQCNHQLHLRAYAKYKEDLTTADYANAFLEGHMALTLNPYQNTQAYQSIVPILSTSMSENLMHYFAQSEQIPSRVWLTVNDNIAAGMLLQLMPGQNSQQREEFWEYAIQLGQTVSEKELLHLDNETLLHRLYHETELRLFASRPIRFQCRCDQQKMKQVLKVIGKADIEQLLQEHGFVEIGCDFCNQHYRFDSIDIALLFHQ